MRSKKGSLIKITRGKEYQAKNDKVYQKEVFFSDVYRQARRCMFEIYTINQQYQKQLTQNECARAGDTKLRSIKLNNIVAFCADRGQGKTSALHSFADELVQREQICECERDRKDRKKFWKDSPIGFPHFKILCESIDPAVMLEKDSILRVILSRMFRNFREKLEKEIEPNEATVQELIEGFQNCFRYVDVVEKGQNRAEEFSEDDLDRIVELGDSLSLRHAISQLIDRYLKYMYEDADTYLLIPVDDADMNVRLAYNIMEDIRKYLMVPRVVILMACNMQQMESVVEQHFIQEYRDSIAEKRAMVTLEKVHHIAEMYLEKVIPNTRRIYLPCVADFWKRCSIRYKDPLISSQDDEDWGDPDKAKEETNLLDNSMEYDYQEQLLRFLHRKTGLIFVKTESYLHNLLPQNLRELTHFLAYFGGMEDVSPNNNKSCYEEAVHQFITGDSKRENETLIRWKRNLDKLQDYVEEMWSAVRLREQSRVLLREWIDEPQGHKHYFLLKTLPDYYANERIAYAEMNGNVYHATDDKLRFIEECAKRNVKLQGIEIDEPIWATYADVMTALSVLTDLPGANRQYAFVYAIRLCYSIMFHQMLLRRLGKPEESAGKWDNISFFMGDAFLKGEIATRNSETVKFSYQRILLNSSEIFTSSVMNGEWQKISAGDVNQFLRWEEIQGIQKRTAPLLWEESWDNGQNLSERKGISDLFSLKERVVFNPFYPLLHELDAFSLIKESASRKHYEEDSTLRPRLLTALVVLLNYDVQHELTRALRREKLNFHTFLTDCAARVFVGGSASEVYRSLRKTNADCPLDEELTQNAFLSDTSDNILNQSEQLIHATENHNLILFFEKKEITKAFNALDEAEVLLEICREKIVSEDPPLFDEGKILWDINGGKGLEEEFNKIAGAFQEVSSIIALPSTTGRRQKSAFNGDVTSLKQLSYNQIRAILKSGRNQIKKKTVQKNDNIVYDERKEAIQSPPVSTPQILTKENMELLLQNLTSFLAVATDFMRDRKMPTNDKSQNNKSSNKKNKENSDE